MIVVLVVVVLSVVILWHGNGCGDSDIAVLVVFCDMNYVNRIERWLC